MPPKPKPLGPPLPPMIAQAAIITPADVAAAGRLWHRDAPAPVKALIDATVPPHAQ